MTDENPFDLLDVDPGLDARELTRVLQQRAERANGEERTRLQKLWRQLTLKESDRVRWALLAHPRPASSTATDSASLEELRKKIPPFFGNVDLPALTPTVEDALVLPGMDAAAPDKLEPPDVLHKLRPNSTTHE